MDDTVPTLGVGFAIDTEGAFSQIMRLSQMMDEKTVEIVRKVAQVERATGGMMQFGPATASIATFASAATRELQNVTQSKAKTERAGEALVRQLEREAAAMGRTREQMREAKVEALALAAAQQGNTDLADRLLAASRQRQMAAESVAEAQAAAAAEQARRAAEQRAAAEAVVNAQLMERARLQAALERTERLDRPRAIDNGASFSALDERAKAQAAAARQAEINATNQAAREHAELAAAVRNSHAAQIADAEAAERLRAATDPLYAATKRLNEQIAESTRLYYAGATAPAEYARQQEVLMGRLREVGRQQEQASQGLGAVGTSGKLAGHHMQNLAFQFQDLGVQMMAAAGSSAPLKMGFMALMQQGMQIQGIMSQAGVGVRAVGAAFISMSKSVLVATLTNPILLGIAAAIGAAAGAVALLTSAANKGADMKEYAKSLGLTAKEIRGLDNVTVTWGDTTKAVFQVAGRAIWQAIGPAVTSAWEKMKEWAAWIFSGWKGAMNFLIGGMVGGYNVITKTWSYLPSVIGNLFNMAVNASIDAINAMVRKVVEGVNWMVTQANRILPHAAQLPSLKPAQIDHINDQYKGAFARFGKTGREEMQKALGTDYVGNAGKSIGGAIVKQTIQNANDRIKKQAEEKGYLDPKKGKTDRHAEQLARENEAIEAQIRNLYALADAYKVSGAAALIAEARTKAESDAIKNRGDIEVFVNRQIRLAIAQRVVDADKATAGMRDQIEAQRAVNAMVAAGLVPAQQAADLVKDRIADLPLLAAIEAAQQRGLSDEAKRATAALEDQRAKRAELRKEEEKTATDVKLQSDRNRLAELREELRLIGATDEARARALAEFKAAQETSLWQNKDPAKIAEYIKLQGDIAAQTVRNTQVLDAYNAALTLTADKWDIIAGKVQTAAQGMADAFGDAGRAIGDVASIYANYEAQRSRAIAEHDAAVKKAAGNEQLLAQENARWALRSSGAQITMYGDMASAAKGFFKEGTAGYQAMQRAEQVFRAVQFALSVRAMAQNAAETATSIANSAARTATHAVEAVVKAIASLPFPLNLAAGAATVAALASLGVSIAGSFGGGGKLPPANDGTGTVLGDTTAKSDSIKRALDALKEVDTLTSNYAREMSASLKSIDSQIGNVAGLVVRAGDISANAQVKTGFELTALSSILSKAPSSLLLGGVGALVGGPIGWLAGTALGALTSITKDIPIIGDILGGISGVINSLFGSSTSVIANGLYGRPQSVGSIMSGGFDANYYSDVEKKKKFFGIITGRSYSTKYADAAPELKQQFTLILKSFAGAIKLAAGPLGESTAAVEARLNSFVVDIGKIDLKGLTGQQIQEKLTAVFGAAADKMANAAFPGILQFQKVGEGAFETLVRVASTVDSVNQALGLLGQQAQGLGTAAALGLADQFDSVSAMGSAVEAYFKAFYSQSEQAAAKQAQMAQVFSALGITMPATLTAYRQLVEAQDLNTAAGRETYATLLKLAPAFADLKTAMEGAKSAADVLNERGDLERQLLQLQGNTAAIRALDLAKLDASNRELQQQIWALQDAQEAAKAADELRKAWTSVGDSIMDEVKRIRGLTDTAGNGTFASLMGQFNAATLAARGGDQDAAKSLPQLSQALLAAAAKAATSRQELDRVQAQTAASLEATYAALARYAAAANPAAPATAAPAMTTDQLLRAAATSQPATVAAPANDDLAAELRALRSEVAAMRADNNAGHAATASNTGGIKRTMDRVTAQSGGDAISTVAAA